MHDKCQNCLKIRRFLFALLGCGVFALLSEQAGWSRQVTLWGGVAVALVLLAWLNKKGPKPE